MVAMLFRGLEHHSSAVTLRKMLQNFGLSTLIIHKSMQYLIEKIQVSLTSISSMFVKLDFRALLVGRVKNCICSASDHSLLLALCSEPSHRTVLAENAHLGFIYDTIADSTASRSGNCVCGTFRPRT